MHLVAASIGLSIAAMDSFRKILKGPLNHKQRRKPTLNLNYPIKACSQPASNSTD
jgi:hypothetical protein